MDGVCSGGYSTAAAGHSGRSEGRGWMDDFAGESSYLQHRMRSVCWPGLVEPALQFSVHSVSSEHAKNHLTRRLGIP
jgi:hypothetical protein